MEWLDPAVVFWAGFCLGFALCGALVVWHHLLREN
jgi:hypothetical protein